MAREPLIVELRRPWIWLPVAVGIPATQIYAIRHGYSGGTDLYRWLWNHPRLFTILAIWWVITECHFHRRPRRFVKYDPYAPLAYALAPRKAPVVRSEPPRCLPR